MARNLINIRVELDRETDSDVYAMAKHLYPHTTPSKRAFLTRIARRTTKLWKQNPESSALRELGLIKHGLD